MKSYACAAGSNSETARLIHEHIDMARRIALRVARRLPDWITTDDVVAAAMVGLTEAADRYDSTRGEPFAAFAEKRIRGAVLDELRRGDLMPRRARVKARQVGQAAARLEGKLGRPPEDEELALELGVSVEEYREDLAGLTHVALIDLERAGAANLADPSTSPAAHAERDELVSQMRAGLDRIPERDAQILSLYYLEDLSYSEIGEVLGVTESRICQLHARAISRLRAELIPGGGRVSKPRSPALAAPGTVI